MIIKLTRQPPREVFPYGVRVRFAEAPSNLDEVRCMMGRTSAHLYEWSKEMFGGMAEAREFWLEEGTPSGSWYHSTNQFWFLKEHDLFLFYMHFHTKRQYK